MFVFSFILSSCSVGTNVPTVSNVQGQATAVASQNEKTSRTDLAVAEKVMPPGSICSAFLAIILASFLDILR